MACTPRVVKMTPKEGAPNTSVSLHMEYLVGWPRVQIGGRVIDYHQLKLSSAEARREHVPDEELYWGANKVIQFKVPILPPGDYAVKVYDDKGPPGDPVYSFLETSAYVVFPPVWPFVFRSNQASVGFRVTPAGK